jgi:hypothetical protein
VPVLFTVDGGIINLKASTYLPNMINMVVVKNSAGQRKLIVPDPCFLPFETELRARLSAIGYGVAEIEYVDTLGPHGGGGEAHCATVPRRIAL